MTEHYMYDAVDDMARPPRTVYAIRLSWADPETGRRKSMNFFYSQKGKAMDKFKRMTANMDPRRPYGEALTMLCSPLSWEEVEVS